MYHKQGSVTARLKALDFIRTICRMDDYGYAVYDDGWSDKKVARHVGKLPTSVISAIRREYIGKSRAAVDRWNRHAAHVAAQPVLKQAAIPQSTAVLTPLVMPVVEATLTRLDSIERKLDAILNAWSITERVGK